MHIQQYYIGPVLPDCSDRLIMRACRTDNDDVLVFIEDEKWKDKTGEAHEPTEWLKCNAFDRLADVCGEYVRKGQLVYVDGPLHTRKYTDKDGVERFSTECRVQAPKLLGRRDDDAREPRPAAKPAAKPAAAPATAFDDMDDDIPFISQAFAHDMATPIERKMARYKL